MIYKTTLQDGLLIVQFADGLTTWRVFYSAENYFNLCGG